MLFFDRILEYMEKRSPVLDYNSYKRSNANLHENNPNSNQIITNHSHIIPHQTTHNNHHHYIPQYYSSSSSNTSSNNHTLNSNYTNNRRIPSPIPNGNNSPSIISIQEIEEVSLSKITERVNRNPPKTNHTNLNNIHNLRPTSTTSPSTDIYNNDNSYSSGNSHKRLKSMEPQEFDLKDLLVDERNNNNNNTSNSKNNNNTKPVTVPSNGQSQGNTIPIFYSFSVCFYSVVLFYLIQCFSFRRI